MTLRGLRLDTDILQLSTLIEKIIHVKVKDCFADPNNTMLYVVVNPGQLGKAIGKGGLNIRKIQQEMGKRVRMIEYNDQVSSFVKNVIYPLKVESITEDEKGILIKDSNKKTKSLLIGRGGGNLELINRAIKRFFNKEVRVE